MKRFLLPLLTAAVLVLPVMVLPGTAHGAVPCRDEIYNDWYASGKISTKYPIACYRDALKHVPSDAAVYSSLASDIKDALAAALRGLKDPATPAPKEVGSGSHGTKGASASFAHGAKGSSASGPRSPDHGRVRALTATETASPPTNGGLASAPLPILILGAIALALAAAGMIGTGVRYARGRNR